MAALPPCIYKSVTMSAGETFVLPPGAEIISVSDLGAVTNSCPDALPTEELKCYRMAWVINIDPEGTKTVGAMVIFPPFGGGAGAAVVHVPNTGGAWENTDGDTASITIDKVSIAGTVISAGMELTDFAALESVIAGSSVGGIMSDRKYNHYDQIQPLTTAEQAQWGSFWRSGYSVYTLAFKSIPSVAETIYLEFLSALDDGGGNIGSIPRYFAKEIECSAYPTTTEL